MPLRFNLYLGPSACRPRQGKQPASIFAARHAHGGKEGVEMSSPTAAYRFQKTFSMDIPMDPEEDGLGDRSHTL